MGVHLYCIVPASYAVPDDCVGLDGTRPRLLEAGPLGLWAGELETAPRPTVDAARRHDAVIRAAMTTVCTPVPVRFGQWFAAPAEAADRVATDAAGWQALLDRFAGRAEYGVRVTADRDRSAARDVHAARAHTGTAYMAALAQKQAVVADRRAGADHLAALIRDRATIAVADQWADPAPAPGTVVALAHLIAWSDVATYHSAVDTVRAERPDLRFLLTGPWPPYSFVP